jgi:hypothetical protein
MTATLPLRTGGLPEERVEFISNGSGRVGIAEASTWRTSTVTAMRREEVPRRGGAMGRSPAAANVGTIAATSGAREGSMVPPTDMKRGGGERTVQEIWFVTQTTMPDRFEISNLVPSA